MIFLGKRKIYSAFILLACLGVSGWFWRHRESIPYISQPLSIASSPFQYGASRISQLGKDGIRILDGVFTQWEELDKLKKENSTLRAEQARYSEILAENVRYRDLLKFKQGYTQFSLLGATVIARDYGAWTQTITIDRGEDSGIRKYMPVMIPTGLVGFVSEVYANTSKVQLLLDPRTSIGGIVQRPTSRVVSMVSGNSSEPGLLTFTSLPKEADVIKGDVIVTSGYGGVYPKGLVIGTVQKVDIDTLGGTQVAEIKPAADFSHMEEVFVITNQIEKTMPESITSKPPAVEPTMNPNKKQAGVR